MALLNPLRQAVNLYFNRLSRVFVLASLVLVLAGAAVQLSRELRLAAETRSSLAPAFEASLAVGPAPASGGAGATGHLPGAGAATATDLPSARIALTAPLKAGPSPTLAPTASPPPPRPERLVIPSIGLDTAVVEVGWEARVVNGEQHGNVWQTASFAAGHHRDSAPPGTAGNLVISGHNNIEGAVFGALHRLEPLAWIYVFAGGRRFAYLVEERFIVPEAGATPAQRLANVKWIGPSPDERLTLLTCYPPWSNTHRTIVLARPIHDPALLPADAPQPPAAEAATDLDPALIPTAAPGPADPPAP